MKKNSYTNNPDVWMSTVVLIWGLNTPSMKQIISNINQWTFVGFRFVCISVLSLLSYYVIQKKSDLLRFKKNDMFKLILASFFAFGSYQYFLMYGLALTPVFLATILVGFSPLFAILISHIFKLEVYTWKVWLGVIIAFVGVILFKYNGSELFDFGDSIKGELYCLGSALSWAGYTLIMRSDSLKQYSGEQINTFTMLVGTCVVLTFSFNDVYSFEFSTITTDIWLLIIYTVVFPIFLAYKLYNASIKKVGVERTVLFIYLVPIISGFVSILFGMEEFTLMKLLGAIVVISGMLIARKG